MSSSTDRIEKKVTLRASRERVWEAISDSRQFATWFGLQVDAPFVAGARVDARIGQTQVDDEIARFQASHVGKPCVLLIETIEPMRLFSFRWHPGADADPNDPDAVTTLVTFELADAEEGVLLTICETGFDRLPAAQRAKAFANNEGGWQAQAGLIAKYLARAS